MPRFRSLLLLSIAGAFACGDSPAAPRDLTLEFLPSVVARSLAGDTVRVALRATSGGAPLAGASVAWTVTGGGALLEAASATDAAGAAKATWRLGTALERGAITAMVDGVRLTAGTQTAPKPPFSLVFQNATPTGASAMDDVPFGVAVTDRFGNPVADEPVSWTAQISVPGVTTDSVLFPTDLARPQRPVGGLLCVGGGAISIVQAGADPDVVCYDPARDAWESAPPFPGPLRPTEKVDAVAAGPELWIFPLMQAGGPSYRLRRTR